MNYKLFCTILILHAAFIIGGYFVLQYSIFLLLSQTMTVQVVGYLFLLFFFCVCIAIHYLVVDMYDAKTTPKKKWFLSVSGMCFSTFVAFLFLAFLF